MASHLVEEFSIEDDMGWSVISYQQKLSVATILSEF
ncbi:hypothetical protein LINPERPRIM_LOCUS38439 [Linum perenne]